MSRIYNWRNFWILWGGGLVFLAVLGIFSAPLITHVSLSPISDHQKAGSAEAVNIIQHMWRDLGIYNYAIKWFTAELVFIGIYMSGGIIGGRLIWQNASSTALKKLGLICVILFGAFGLTDYVETICQYIQLVSFAGSDFLAGIAAFISGPKIVAFFAAGASMIVALVWRLIERRT